MKTSGSTTICCPKSTRSTLYRVMANLVGKTPVFIPSSKAQARPDQVVWIKIGPDADGQRLDNYLFRIAKGVPKSHLYRIVRGGEVRVN